MSPVVARQVQNLRALASPGAKGSVQRLVNASGEHRIIIHGMNDNHSRFE